MVEWIVLILMLGIAGGAAWLALRGRSEARGRADVRRRRFLIRDSNERVLVYDDRDGRRKSSSPDRALIAEGPSSMQAILRAMHEEQAATEAPGGPPELSIDASSPRISRRHQPEPVHLPGSPSGSMGRVVRTPDGEMVLTTPPFVARDSIFSPRRGRYVIDLARRLPPWIALCPRVRLDALVKATPPVGCDPADWREWRRRVRWRAVDVLLCDARTWRPILAIEIGRPNPAPDVRSPWCGSDRGRTAGRSASEAPDRILEEVFIAVGIPFLRGSGVVASDWPLIRPYVEESILTTRDVCVEGDAAMTGNDVQLGREHRPLTPREEKMCGLLGEGLLAEPSPDPTSVDKSA